MIGDKGFWTSSTSPSKAVTLAQALRLKRPYEPLVDAYNAREWSGHGRRACALPRALYAAELTDLQVESGAYAMPRYTHGAWQGEGQLYVARERGVTEEEQSDATAELSTLPPGESKTEQPHRLARPLEDLEIPELETDLGSLETPE
jgi:hypothetical protein